MRMDEFERLDGSEDENASIERVLGGLRQVETPVHMEQRIMAGLAARAAENQHTSARKVMPWAVAGVMAACGVVGVVALRMHGKATVDPAMTAARSSGPATVVPARQIQQKSDGETVASETPIAAAGRGSEKNVASARVSGRAGEKKDEIASVAEREDVPAPPLPLTGEERMLLRVAHRGQTEPVEMADFSPETKAKAAAQEAAEFEAFFTPPKLPTEKTAN